MHFKMSASAKSRVKKSKPFQVPVPSKLELNCIPLFEPRGYRHTGDGTFWIRGRDGKSKNPDFKKTGSRAVIEVWGDYWHRGQDPQDLIDWYAENDYECEVYWEHELKVNFVDYMGWRGKVGCEASHIEGGRGLRRVLKWVDLIN